MTVAPTKDFVSIGTLASQLRVTVRAIERAADELNLAPAARINLIIYYDGNQTARLTEHLVRKQEGQQ